MEELELQNSDDFNDAFRQELGNLYGVKIVILGNITKFTNQIIINIRGIEVSTGVAVFADALTIDSEKNIADKIFNFVKELSLTKGLNKMSNKELYNFQSLLFRRRIYKKVAKGLIFSGSFVLGTGLSILGAGIGSWCYGGYLFNLNWDADLPDEENISNANLSGGSYMTVGVILMVIGGVTSGIGLTLDIVAISLFAAARFYKKLINNKSSVIILPYFKYVAGLEFGVFIKI
ncbi:MAG: hypothetical protein KAT05_01915 [Spirochaetes bacterium]|nr:hypothetical protein [Spirochaetota bacterium]